MSSHKLTEKRQCERNLIDFIKSAWAIVEPGTPYVQNWHIEMISHHLEAITDEEEVDGEIYNRLLINVPPGMMKALDSETPILTTWGWKRHGDLGPGDFVFGPDGKPRRVIAVTPEVLEEAASLIFDDGTRITAGLAHEWVVERDFMDAASKWRRTRRPMIVETRDLRVGARPDLVRCAEAIHLPPRNLIVDPYVLGAWLGDGGTDSGCLYVGEEDASHFLPYGRVGTLYEPGEQRRRRFFRIVVPGLQTQLRVMGVLGKKHIPDDYAAGSIEQRWALLQGMMDTDGTVDPKGSCSFTNANAEIAEGLARIVESLGMKAYRRSRYTTLNGKRFGPHYRITFTPQPGAEPFRLKRKLEKIRALGSPRGRSRYLKEIIPVGVRATKCIQVEGGIYLAGTAMTPTHNSLLVAVFWPAWEWGPRNMPATRYVCLSHDMTNTIRDNVRMRRLVMSDWYQAYWGDRLKLTGDQNVKTYFENSATGFRQAASFDSVTGKRGDRIILDDPNSWDSANSEQQRMTTNEWFLGALQSRMNHPKRSAIIVIMQRLHEEDVSGVILEHGGTGLGYDHIMLPMRYDPHRGHLNPLGPVSTKLGYDDPRREDGALLFAERFPLGYVDRIEKTMGPYEISGQHQQSPEPKGGGIIKDRWWQLWPQEKFPDWDYIIASLDTAYGEKQENDYSALTIWGVFSTRADQRATAQAPTQPADRYAELDRYGRRTQNPEPRTIVEGAVKIMLMFAWREKLPFPKLVDKVLTTCREMAVDKIIIENKAAGISIAQELRRIIGGEEFGIQLLDTKSLDKVARLYSVQHLFSESMIYAPDKAWAEMVIREVSSFPKGKHDDLVDTVSQCLRHLRDIGVLTRAPERLQEIEFSKQYTGRPPASLYPG